MTSSDPLDLLVVFTQPPLTASLPKEGLDLALVSSTFAQRTGLIFLGAGVLQLQPNQAPEVLALKGTQAMLNALELYDLEQIYVEAQALVDYRLTNLSLPAESCSKAELETLIAKSRHLIIF